MTYIADPEAAELQARIDEAKARPESAWNRGRLDALELQLQWIKAGRQQPLDLFPPYKARMQKYNQEMEQVARNEAQMTVAWIRATAGAIA